MKCRLCLPVLVLLAFSSACCDLFAIAAEQPPEPPKLAAAGILSEDGNVATSPPFMIPGPLRSFYRMAGISQKIRPEEVLPLLGRNVFMQGYEASTRPTEFLILLRRYVVQARELSNLAASQGMIIRVSNCDDAAPLLRILGYRARPNCGTAATTLHTEDPERAFVAIDSGFPLPELERALQGGKPFEYSFFSSPVPVLFDASDWTKASRKNHNENSRDLLDTILYDPEVARLYWAFSKMDPETAKTLQQSIGIGKLLPYGAELDFYGGSFCISGGRVIVPGGVDTEAAWKNLVGASPENPVAFAERLLSKDKGWMVAYFDVLSRAKRAQQVYFTQPQRLQLFYEGLRSADPSTKATVGSFRPAAGLLLLTTRLQLENGKEPLIPGALGTWKEILSQGENAKLVRKANRSASHLSSSDQFLETMFALSRAPTESGPLQIYMAVSELDSRRSAENHLSPATVRLLARKFEDLSDQYRIFSEFPELNDESITLFFNVVQNLNSVPVALRGNAYGIFQANLGIWQILARQGEISRGHLNDSWRLTIKPFASVRSAAQLYDAGRTSLSEIFRASTGKARGSQDEIIDLLAGPRQTSAEGLRMHAGVAGRIRAVLDDQRLVSLDTELTLGDALSEKAQGKQPEDFMLMLAGQTREFEMPRPIFTTGERSEWAAGIYNNHHTDVEMRADIARVLKSAKPSRAQIDEARGLLASFLRDTLVGLNYAYYEPPGAQALHNNPLFVRSHDFSGETISGLKTLWQAPELVGQGSPAGGGAHFAGSLADLPFALAQLEQDFISPENTQALIWKELTPELMTSAILPRWWDVSPLELHAVALYQRAGEELLTASAGDEALRRKVMDILSERLLPRRTRQIEQALSNGHSAEMLAEIMPADTFYLAAEFQRQYPQQAAAAGAANLELQRLLEEHSEQVNWGRLSHDFGTPHPSLAQNYGLELLNLTPIPSLSGYPSRFLAESWDSPNLYWARLADEEGYSCVMLNYLVPQLTRRMVEKIFATDREDWPALLRAMHEAGDDFRQGKLASTATVSAARP